MNIKFLYLLGKIEKKLNNEQYYFKDKLNTMNRIFLTLIIAAAIIASCNSSNTSNNNKQPLVVAAADATIKFQCPMSCQGDTTYTTKGKCPVCEMDLDKVK